MDAFLMVLQAHACRHHQPDMRPQSAPRPPVFWWAVKSGRCNPLSGIVIPRLASHSKAQVARSNRAGQAKFHIGSNKPRLEDCG